MRAVLCKQFGPPEDLVIDEVADPTPGPGEVLIEVKAAPVTFPDTLMLEDKYQFKADLPYIPGGEVAGTVTAIGADVTGIEVGERVVSGLGAVGGYAEFAVAKENAVRKLPDGVGFAESTGLLYAHGTTYYGLKERADLQPGESLLVLGAGGHVGLSAVEIGKLMGARVIAAASSEEKLDLCRERGADETINYSEESLKDRAKELTNGEGVNVIYDVVGGDYAEQALRAIAWEGRFLVIGFTAGIPAIPLNLTLLKSCQIVGVFYGAMTSRDPKLANEIAEDLLGWVANGDLKPHISATYGLDGAAGALRNLMDRKSVGKIVIEP
ncbi:MAG: NADPH:quinone oxidoreductase [Euryarchaeota archaeon]|jgi:NADPH2:quinone reductase|nr:NADPH:quinone oxidoreductase [Acidimicrobiaceae bacterium]MAU86114.1 NADPH:quinone oxidoreductase [Euryarchaeota archaeon]MCH2632917.1 NADPH:quinone oxidoreductase family protein [Acidimicrobiales bacterium]OUW32740.1 MAG: NADPH:quinone oxidoreductase [Actinobacteria bacterium TMED172]HCK73493.1 NADPH:quinone oxidoreductase [Acidimicrobiaceae bacterium]|tara:strand:- start:1511 stop:2485 length:975 start_codon:yes stop_codon:yes gene_type:complete